MKGAGTKTGKARTIGLEVSPTPHKLLSAMRLASGGKGPVFEVSPGTIEAGGEAPAQRVRRA